MLVRVLLVLSLLLITFLPEICTFLIAGHRTVSAAVSWKFFGLCQNLEAQRKLREELLAPPTDDPTMDELKNLPFLDMVLRESLRLYSPLHTSKRVAVKDTTLPMRDGSSIRRVSCPNFNASTTRSDPSASVCTQHEQRGGVVHSDPRDEHRQRYLGQ